MEIFLSTLTSFFFGFLITPVLIYLLKKGNVIDAPGGRRIHRGFVPSMGGVAIVLATFASIMAWFSLEQLIVTRYFLVGLGIMFSVGMRDDLIELSAMQKLIGQCIPAFFVVVMADIRFTGLYGFMGVFEIPYFASVGLTILALIILTNSFNLIDGSDGLAGILSLVGFLFLGCWFYTTGLMAYSLISFSMVGAVLSFLVFNWHPAKIFMGDTGSLSLGFALTALTILFVDTNGTMLASEGFKINAPIACGIALMIVPMYDTLRIFIKRILNGKSPFRPDKSHIHHFLLRMGFKHNEVALILGGVMLAFVALVVGSSLNDHIMIPIVIALAVILGAWLDEMTLRRVKIIYKKVPHTEADVAITKRSHSKARISHKVFDPNKINMN